MLPPLSVAWRSMMITACSSAKGDRTSVNATARNVGQHFLIPWFKEIFAFSALVCLAFPCFSAFLCFFLLFLFLLFLACVAFPCFSQLLRFSCFSALVLLLCESSFIVCFSLLLVFASSFLLGCFSGSFSQRPCFPACVSLLL